MSEWPRIIRGAIRLGLTWAIPWTLVGFAIEVVHDIWPTPLGSSVDIWPAALGGPALLGGFAFSILLGILARRRKLADLSLPGFTALGAVGGALVGAAPAVMVLVGFASIHGTSTLWQVAAPMMASCALLGGASAAGSLVLARRAESQTLANGEVLR